MKYEITFSDVGLAVAKALDSYSGIKVLKYEEPIKDSSGAFLVCYKDIDEDVFTYTVLFDYDQDKCATVDLIDCDGRGFASTAMTVDSLVELAAFLRAIKEMFDETFSDEMIEYNIKAYHEED